MEIAKLVLEYVKVLVWPTLVIAAVCRYRTSLQKLIDRIAAESQEVAGFGLSAKLRPPSPSDATDATELPPPALLPPENASGAPSSLPELTPLTAAPALVAEELVMRALEAKWGSSIGRDWMAELPNGRKIRFDGVVNSSAQTIIVEVKLLTSPRLPADVFINLAEDVIALRQHFKKPIIAVIALVAPEETSEYEKVAQEAAAKTEGAPIPLLVEFFYLPQLWLVYSGILKR